MRECTFVHMCVSTKMRVCVPVCVRAAMHTGNDRCQHLWAVMRLRPAGAVSSLGPGGGPLSCLVARAQPSYSTCDLLCLQEGGTCFMHGGYLQAGVSRLWDQERLPGGQAAPPSPLYGHSPHLLSFLLCVLVMPWDTCEGVLDLLPASYSTPGL